MKSVLRRTLTIGSLLAFCCGIGAVAQDRDDDWYHNRDSFYHGEHWRARLFDRVRDDVDHVQSTTFPVSKDEFRLVRVKEQLNDLQSKMANGQYDEGELDEVVHSLQRVVDSNKLSGRDREILTDDLAHLREYREHHEDWERR